MWLVQHELQFVDIWAMFVKGCLSFRLSAGSVVFFTHVSRIGLQIYGLAPMSYPGLEQLSHIPEMVDIMLQGGLQIV